MRSSVPLDNTTHGKELKKLEKLKELNISLEEAEVRNSEVKPLALRLQVLRIQKFLPRQAAEPSEAVCLANHRRSSETLDLLYLSIAVRQKEIPPQATTPYKSYNPRSAQSPRSRLR